MTKGRTFTGLVALTALTIAVLAPCVCHGCEPVRPPSSCHEAMAHQPQQAHSGHSSPLGQAWVGVSGSCCEQSTAPLVATPATYRTHGEPDGSTHLAVGVTPAHTYSVSSSSERAEPSDGSSRLTHAPPLLLLPLRI